MSSPGQSQVHPGGSSSGACIERWGTQLQDLCLFEGIVAAAGLSRGWGCLEQSVHSLAGHKSGMPGRVQLEEQGGHAAVKRVLWYSWLCPCDQDTSHRRSVCGASFCVNLGHHDGALPAAVLLPLNCHPATASLCHPRPLLWCLLDNGSFTAAGTWTSPPPVS